MCFAAAFDNEYQDNSEALAMLALNYCYRILLKHCLYVSYVVGMPYNDCWLRLSQAGKMADIKPHCMALLGSIFFFTQNATD